MADHASKIPIPEERQDLLSRGVAQASSYAQPKPISRAAAVSTYCQCSLMGTVPEIGFDQMDVSTRCTQHQSRRPANHHGSAPEESHLDQPSTPTTMLWIIHPSIHPLQRSPVHDSLNQQQQTPTTNRASRSRTPEPACIAADGCHDSMAHPRHAYHAAQLVAATRPSAPFRAVPPSNILCSHHAHSRHEDGTCGRGHFLSSAFLLWESLCRHWALLKPPCGSHWISSNP
ncbi:hypothetical protein B0J15DRAFT_187380 [Fusarium solani]|uniref:Uncharacterized protein n=1 Tax=Fusarium solani TaxID=169388 RepID=A0A9P9RBJ7_FUSSL|nr:uncharacterized protein B0J15DRAFT_187380 [Fusarium solani]KAH7272784.1 hypothetical protein B0J15DRAFT_187380 [Fusarium solani]